MADLDQARDCFDRALALPIAERETFVRSILSCDAGLRDRVLAMLAQHSAGDSALPEDSPSHFAALGDQHNIGPYRLLEKIGEGGFGIVWLGERRHPMVQRVAIKIVKPGMDSKQVLARFEQERQTLALMDHPNVAKVLDGGVTAQGLPYFVMEYVAGENFVQYCDRYALAIPHRLELFQKVCDAIQHAHLKGIIHRDIKPSNILVTERDGKPIPKVIDFGIAKAVTGVAGEHTVFTHAGTLIGTPEYMSPEQANHSSRDIDSRTDVYSLGVVLYELLAGVSPLRAEIQSVADPVEVCKIICECSPSRPATKLTGMGQGAVEVARKRGVDAKQLAAILNKELEWIPLKALRKDRTQRYETPRQLAEDIDRYLTGRPLEAGPESARYRLAKYSRRHRATLMAIAAITASLVGAVVVSAVFASRAARARDAATAEKAVAIHAAQRLERLNDFLRGLFRWQKPGQVTVKDILARGEAMLRVTPFMPPDQEASQRLFLAYACAEAGLPKDATAHLAMAEKLLQVSDSGDRALRVQLAVVRAFLLMQDDSEQAEPEAARAVEMGLDLPVSSKKLLVDAYGILGTVQFWKGKKEPAFQSIVQAFVTAREMAGVRVSPSQMYDELDDLATRIANLWGEGQRDRAQQLLAEYQAPYIQVLGADRAVPEGVAAVAMYLEEFKRDSRAKPLYVLAYQSSRRLLGDANPTTAMLAYVGKRNAPDLATSPELSETFKALVDVYGLVPETGMYFLDEGKREFAGERYHTASEMFSKAVRALSGCAQCRVLAQIWLLGSLARDESNKEFETEYARTAQSIDELIPMASPSELEAVAGFGAVEYEWGAKNAAQSRMKAVAARLIQSENAPHDDTVAAAAGLVASLMYRTEQSDSAADLLSRVPGAARFYAPSQVDREVAAYTLTVANLLEKTGDVEQSFVVLDRVIGIVEEKAKRSSYASWAFAPQLLVGWAKLAIAHRPDDPRIQARLSAALGFLLSPAPRANTQTTSGELSLVDLLQSVDSGKLMPDRLAGGMEASRLLAPLLSDSERASLLARMDAIRRQVNDSEKPHDGKSSE